MSYNPIIQKTIHYIENHLQTDLSLDRIARQAGFSKLEFSSELLDEPINLSFEE